MATLKKTYVYKVYSGATYLGMLQNVTSEFSYNQTINSAGAQLDIELGDAFPDISASLSSNYLVDESSNNIIDESGNRLVTDSTYIFSNLPITLGNRVKVTEFDDQNVNGTIVFDGLISIWEADYKENKTTVTVLGFGITLDNFIIKSGDGVNVVVPYADTDPSNIVRDLMDDFSAQGGLISYNFDSIESSGASVDYTFNLNTFLEGIKAMYDLAGGGFYWYVDPAANILYFKDTGTTADHTMVLGKHIDNLVLSQNLDKIKNTVYFSGGEVAGVNIFRFNQNIDSVNLYGQWLDRISNNRVTDDNTADLISIAEIARYSNPDFVGTLTIDDDVYDIESFNLGELVGFRNFNNLIDSLLLQIIGIYRYPGSVELSLGIITQRNSKLLDEVDRRIKALETFNNPDTPT